MVNDIRYIIVHHTERNNDFPAFIKFRHIYLRGWDTIGYHYLIGNRRPFTKDGGLYLGRPENHVGAHARGFNGVSLGICLIGNLNNTNPSPKQLKALVDFLKKKSKQYQIPVRNILGHRELPNVTKSCPGQNLDMDMVRQAVAGQLDLSEVLSVFSDRFAPLGAIG